MRVQACCCPALPAAARPRSPKPLLRKPVRAPDGCTHRCLQRGSLSHADFLLCCDISIPPSPTLDRLAFACVRCVAGYVFFNVTPAALQDPYQGEAENRLKVPSLIDSHAIALPHTYIPISNTAACRLCSIWRASRSARSSSWTRWTRCAVFVPPPFPLLCFMARACPVWRCACCLSFACACCTRLVSAPASGKRLYVWLPCAHAVSMW